MYDLHSKICKFYDDHVRLSSERRKELADYRDLNIERLEDGLELLGEKDGVEYAKPLRYLDQGSYSMHTLNQNPDNEYDLDEGVIFSIDDLPSDPGKARQRIANGFKEVGGNFKTAPEARTNAVTVWYADGIHLDFAIYREVMDENGNTYTEHAGAEWKRRNPVEIRDWFNSRVQSLSPSSDLGATVKADQFRRVVRLLKAFAKSRALWDLPGGFIISVLAAECYQSDYKRDDVALYKTMEALYDRIQRDTHVYDPIYSNQELTDKQKFINQVERFGEKLKDALDDLQTLFGSECSESDGINAWYEIFQHDFWIPIQEKSIRISKSDVRESTPFA